MTALRVVAGVIVQARRLLVCRRPSGRPHPGKWELPGGKAEPGETAEEALRRELREELAIDALVGPRLWCATVRSADGRAMNLEFFHIARFGGEVETLHCEELRWVSPGGLAELDLLEADRDFAERVRHGDIALPDTLQKKPSSNSATPSK